MFNTDWLIILIPKSWRAAAYEAVAFISLSTMLGKLQAIFFEPKPGLFILVIVVCLPIGIFSVVQFLRLQTSGSKYNSLEVLNQHYKDEKVRQSPIKPWNMDSPVSEDSKKDGKSN